MNSGHFGFCALLVLVAAAPSSAQRRCDGEGSPERPFVYEQVQEIPGNAGPFRFRQAVSLPCTRGRTLEPGGKGLVDESGRRVLVPARYTHVIPLGESTALVVERGTRTLAFYDYGTGVRGLAPYLDAKLYGRDEPGQRVGSVWRAAVDPHPTPVAWLPPGRGEAFPTMHVFLGGEKPLVWRQVEERVVLGGIAIVSFFDSSSTQLSRIYTHNLREPLSPVLGRVKAWRQQPADGTGAENSPVLISRAMHLNGHPLFRVGHVHVPIDSTGMPLSLPHRVIGVIPITADPNPESLRAAGWVLVFAADSGVQVSVSHTNLATALAGAGAARRWDGADLLSQYGTTSRREWSALRDPGTGRWQLYDRYLRPIADRVAGGVATRRYTSSVEAGTAYEVAVEAERLASESERQALQRRHEAQTRAADLGAIQARGICAAAALHVHANEVVERYFRECLVDDRTRHLFGGRVSPEARQRALDRGLAAGRAREAEVQRAREAMGAATPATPRQGSSSAANAWARGLEAAQQRVNSSYDTFLQRQHNTYMTNLRAWNSGAQNWCCRN